MAFSGYLMKVGSGQTEFTIPLSLMRYETYQITWQTLDLDSYRDSDGVLHRNALTHKVGKIEFNTPLITNTDVKTLMDGITGAYVNATEKKLLATFYVPETDSYVSQYMYVPDIDFTIRNVDTVNNVINYGETRIAFIGY